MGAICARPSHPGVQPSNWVACGPAALPGLQRLRSPHGGARGGCHWGWRVFLVKVDKKTLGFRCFYEARFEVWGPGFYFFPLHPVLRMAIQQFVGTVLGTHGWSYLVLNHNSPSIEWTHHRWPNWPSHWMDRTVTDSTQAFDMVPLKLIQPLSPLRGPQWLCYPLNDLK